MFYKHKNYHGRIHLVKELSIWLSVYSADVSSLAPIMMTNNSHCSLWLSISICIRSVSRHLLRLIQITNALWQTGAALFRVYEILSMIRWTFVGSLLFNLHLCHGHMHLGIVALLKLVFIQLGSSCATLSDRGGSRRAFWILGSRNLCGQWKKTHLLSILVKIQWLWLLL